MFVPNWVEVYGSQHTQAYDIQSTNKFVDIHESECYHYEMKIVKSGLKALDQPTERCDISTKDPITSKCIAKYIEDTIGCRFYNLEGANARNVPPCTLRSQLESLKNITSKLEEASPNIIYEVTGCLASCERYKFAIDGSFRIGDWGNCYPGPYDLHLDFKITKGSYREEEQYIIYDFNSFIGGVGGILGLCNLIAMGLLGQGVSSLHNLPANLLRRFKKQNTDQAKLG